MVVAPESAAGFVPVVFDDIPVDGVPGATLITLQFNQFTPFDAKQLFIMACAGPETTTTPVPTTTPSECVVVVRLEMNFDF